MIIVNKLYKFLKIYGFDKEVDILKSAYPIIDEGIMNLNENEELKSVEKKELGGYKIEDWYTS